MRFLFCFVFCLFFSIDAMAFHTFADLVEKLMPSVVNISTEKVVLENDEQLDNVMINPSFAARENLGSGFFIKKDGTILTNAHVIKGAKKITITTNDNNSYEAKVIGIDKPSDLAVLKISNIDDKVSFIPVTFGNADNARIGDIVLTFGNPYGLGASVSQGIISAKSRNIGLNEQQYLQTDASINEGNSGGPMFNVDGEVIGVNSAIFKQHGASGVGFSLPSNIANWVANQIINNGSVKRGWLGMSVSYGIDKYTGKEGLVVTEINENSNSYKEGIRVGDIIIAYNDNPAGDIASFLSFVEKMDVDQALRLKTISFGEEIRHVVRIQEMPRDELKNVTNIALKESTLNAIKTIDEDAFYISELGITVKEASPRGLLIIKIDKLSSLKSKGINNGDVILEADRGDIYSVDNLLDSIRNAMVDDFRPISLLIQGINDTFYASVELAVEND